MIEDIILTEGLPNVLFQRKFHIFVFRKVHRDKVTKFVQNIERVMNGKCQKTHLFCGENLVHKTLSLARKSQVIWKHRTL